MRSICLAINDLCARGRPCWHSLHSRHRGVATDPGPLIGRALSERGVRSSILERKSLRIADLFALLYPTTKSIVGASPRTGRLATDQGRGLVGEAGRTQHT